MEQEYGKYLKDSAHDGTVHADVCLVLKIKHKCMHLSCVHRLHIGRILQALFFLVIGNILGLSID